MGTKGMIWRENRELQDDVQDDCVIFVDIKKKKKPEDNKLCLWAQVQSTFSGHAHEPGRYT